MSVFQLSELKTRLLEMGVTPKKSLGQNFLVNLSTCERIVAATLRLNPSGLVEIGPGLGALTHLLISKKLPLRLIELDAKFCDYWRAQGCEVFEADALKLDWNTLSLENGSVLVSNLPYQISASLVIDRSVEPCGLDAMVLMFQKEVAERCRAKCRTEEYGLLSVIAQTFWRVDLVLDCGPKDFYPPPSVGSRVLSFIRNKEQVTEPEKFLRLVKSAFAQRRKLLAKNLEANYSREKILQAFAELAYSPQARAEELSPSDFQKLHLLLLKGHPGS